MNNVHPDTLIQLLQQRHGELVSRGESRRRRRQRR
jgi:hypothetical protein